MQNTFKGLQTKAVEFHQELLSSKQGEKSRWIKEYVHPCKKNCKQLLFSYVLYYCLASLAWNADPKSVPQEFQVANYNLRLYFTFII